MRRHEIDGAAAPRASTPKSNGAGSACDAPAPGKFDQQTEPHFADDEAPRKALATLQAQAALAGCTVHELPDGGYLLTRWSWCKSLADLRSVGDLLRRIGGRP